jgi:integrase
MPKPRSPKLETPTARLRLSVRKLPYMGPKLARGIKLAYRRNKSNGTWVVKAADGAGAYWTKGIGEANDFEPSNGKTVLSFFEAAELAKTLARRQPGDEATDDNRPLTVAEALDAYERDLQARGGDAYNAKRARLHVGSTLASKPVGLLTTSDMTRWRESLSAKKLTPASTNRVRNCLRAGLTLAAKRDRRIQNRHVWEEDLAALPNATRARNIILDDAVVARVIAAAYQHDHALGLLVEVMAVVGARPSQIVRLEVADLDTANMRLMMPRSGKGHTHKRAAKMQERVPVPITRELAAKLRQAIRDPHGKLLTRANGAEWGFRRSDLYRLDFAEVVTAAGLDAATVTLYALRHSMISRSLLRGVPITVVADMTDTSEREIRKHYAKLIAHHADGIARAALLDLSSEPSGNVVPMRPAS